MSRKREVRYSDVAATVLGIVLAALVLGGASFYVETKSDIAVIKERLVSIDQTLKTLLGPQRRP